MIHYWVASAVQIDRFWDTIHLSWPHPLAGSPSILATSAGWKSVYLSSSPGWETVSATSPGWKPVHAGHISWLGDCPSMSVMYLSCRLCRSCICRLCDEWSVTPGSLPVAYCRRSDTAASALLLSAPSLAPSRLDRPRLGPSRLGSARLGSARLDPSCLVESGVARVWTAMTVAGRR